MAPVKRKLDQLIDSLTLKRAKANQTTDQSVEVDDDDDTLAVGGCLKCHSSFKTERDMLRHVLGHFPDHFYLHDKERKERDEDTAEEEKPSSTTAEPPAASATATTTPPCTCLNQSYCQSIIKRR